MCLFLGLYILNSAKIMMLQLHFDFMLPYCRDSSMTLLGGDTGTTVCTSSTVVHFLPDSLSYALSEEKLIDCRKPTVSRKIFRNASRAFIVEPEGETIERQRQPGMFL